MASITTPLLAKVLRKLTRRNTQLWLSGEQWMPRKFQRKILVGVKANSWRFCLHLPLSLLLPFSFSLSPQFLSDRTKTILPFPNKISSRLIDAEKERDATFVLALICSPFKWYRQKEIETGSWYVLSTRDIYSRWYASKIKFMNHEEGERKPLANGGPSLSVAQWFSDADSNGGRGLYEVLIQRRQ